MNEEFGNLMQPNVQTVLFAGGGLAIGIIVGSLLSKGDSYASLRIASVGLLGGLVVGLSESPVLAALATGICAVVAATLPLLVKRKVDAKTAASLRSIHPLNEHTIPFVVGICLGITIGISVRVNNALDFRDKSLNGALTRLGLPEYAVDKVIQRFIASDEILAYVSQQAVTTLPQNVNSSLLADSSQSRLGLKEVLHRAESIPNLSERLKFIVMHTTGEDRTALGEAIMRSLGGDQSVSTEVILKSLETEFSNHETTN